MLPDTYGEITLIHHPDSLIVVLQDTDERQSGTANFIHMHIKQASEILASAGYITIEYGDFVAHEDLPTWRKETK